ncbi:MAG TPA: hypothetical protein VKA97_08215 [Pyrinomonadaceae bacterium]|nr:hypothetical protein [Pyrinomonadaceae bacterium]
MSRSDDVDIIKGGAHTPKKKGKKPAAKKTAAKKTAAKKPAKKR